MALYKRKLSYILLNEGTFKRLLLENAGDQFEIDAAAWIASKKDYSGSSQHTSSLYPDIDLVQKKGSSPQKEAGAEAKMNFDASLGNFSASDVEEMVYDSVSNTISVLTFKEGTKIDASIVTAIKNAINLNISVFEGMYKDFKAIHAKGLSGKRQKRDGTELDYDIPAGEGEFPATWILKSGGRIHTNMPLAKAYMQVGVTDALKGVSGSASRTQRYVKDQIKIDPLADLAVSDNSAELYTSEFEDPMASQYNDPMAPLDFGTIVADMPELEEVNEPWHGSKQVCSPSQAPISGAIVIQNIASHDSSYLIVGEGNTFNPAKCWIGKVGSADPLGLFPANHPTCQIPTTGLELRFIATGSLTMTPKQVGTKPDMQSIGFLRLNSVIK